MRENRNKHIRWLKNRIYLHSEWKALRQKKMQENHHLCERCWQQIRAGDLTIEQAKKRAYKGLHLHHKEPWIHKVGNVSDNQILRQALWDCIENPGLTELLCIRHHETIDKLMRKGVAIDPNKSPDLLIDKL